MPPSSASTSTSTATSIGTDFDALAGYSRDSTSAPPASSTSTNTNASTRRTSFLPARPSESSQPTSRSATREVNFDSGSEMHPSSGGMRGKGANLGRPSKRRDSSYAEELGDRNIPLSPPRNPEMFETEQEWRTYNDREKFDGWHHLPLLLSILPTIGAIIHGRAENWADAIILVLVCYYLYQLIKVPWSIYYASHARRLVDGTTMPLEGEDAAAVRRKKLSASALRRNELLSLSMTIVVPVVGAFLLRFVRGLLSDPDRYINNTIIALFALATSVKPLLHFGKLAKNSSLYHQEVVWYPSTEVHFLRRRVELLEKDISQLTRAFATKDDVRMLRDGVDVPLSLLSKAVRRFDRKEEYLRLSSEERFALLDAKLDEAARDHAIQADLIERLRQEHERFAHPLTALFHVLGHVLGPSRHGQQGQGRMRWFEKGPLMLLFWPVSVSNLALEWVANKGDGPEPVKIMKAAG